MSNPLVGIVVLNWNCPSDTICCLQSIKKSDYHNYHLLVVDNGSSDDSIAQLHEYYSNLEVFESGENLGYAGGNNTGIKVLLERGAEYILLLNDDVILSPDTLSHLARAALEYPNSGFLGPKIVCLEDPKRLLSAGGLLTHDYQSVHRGMGESDKGQYNLDQKVDFLSGSALLVNKTTINQIGWLDEAYFTYYEDIDWCFRGREDGLDCLFVPDAVVRHPDTRERDTGSPLVTYYMARNRLYFIRKHCLGARTAFNILLEDGRTILSWSLRPRWKHKKQQRHALITGILDFFRGRQGKAQHL